MWTKNVNEHQKERGLHLCHLCRLCRVRVGSADDETLFYRDVFAIGVALSYKRTVAVENSLASNTSGPEVHFIQIDGLNLLRRTPTNLGKDSSLE